MSQRRKSPPRSPLGTWTLVGLYPGEGTEAKKKAQALKMRATRAGKVFRTASVPRPDGWLELWTYEEAPQHDR